ncbi:aldolase [Amylostereum chailletii]|nr:aldolase [Amylostereum chailletii]
MSSPPSPGVYVPAILFFTPEEELDVPAIQAHIHRLARGGVTGILVQGSNGEAQHLSREERKAAIRLTRDTLDAYGFQNTVVIAGTGAQSTRETKLFNADAAEAGASHALILTPSTWRPVMSKEHISRFHREASVADASPIPTMIYNFPVVTAGLDLDSDTIDELGRHPNIVGTKLSCGHLGKLTRLVTSSNLAPGSFATFIGRSDSFLPALFMGGAGGIMAAANIAPKAHHALLSAYKAGDLDQARLIQRMLSQTDGLLGKYGGIGFIKAVVAKEFGYGGPTVRGPLLESSVDKLNEADGAILSELIAFEKLLSNVTGS